MLEPVEVRVFLDPFAKVIAQLGANLGAAESPWAPLVQLVEARARLVPTSFVPTPQPATEAICHDNECEAPVTWDSPAQPLARPMAAVR